MLIKLLPMLMLVSCCTKDTVDSTYIVPRLPSKGVPACQSGYDIVACQDMSGEWEYVQLCRELEIGIEDVCLGATIVIQREQTTIQESVEVYYD